VGVVAAAVALGYVVIALAPASWCGVLIPYEYLHQGGLSLQEQGGVSLTEVIFAGWGLGVFAAAAAAAARLCRRRPGGWDRSAWFLVVWLALEVAGYFALTPFPATRRVMGTVVAATLLIGGLAARTCRTPARTGLVRAIAVFGVLLGLGFWAVDMREAVAQKQAVEAAAERIRQEDPDATIWCVGYWGFQFHALRAGMTQVVPAPLGKRREELLRREHGRIVPLPPSQLRAGDWLILPDPLVSQQHIQLDPRDLDVVDSVRVGDWLPLRTVKCFYAGHAPLQHRVGPRIEVMIVRVKADCVPMAP
jgi:hypothetical protein